MCILMFGCKEPQEANSGVTLFPVEVGGGSTERIRAGWEGTLRLGLRILTMAQNCINCGIRRTLFRITLRSLPTLTGVSICRWGPEILEFWKREFYSHSNLCSRITRVWDKFGIDLSHVFFKLHMENSLQDKCVVALSNSLVVHLPFCGT